MAAANGQTSRNDGPDAFLALNDNFSGSSYTFADSMAGLSAVADAKVVPWKLLGNVY